MEEKRRRLEVLRPDIDDDSEIVNSDGMEDIIADIATTGRVEYEWLLVAKLFKIKMIQACDEMFRVHGFVGPVTQIFENRKDELLRLLLKYDTAPPFTVQRFAEVLTTGKSQYKTTHKYMNSLEKLLSVTSTLSEFES